MARSRRSKVSAEDKAELVNAAEEVVWAKWVEEINDRGLPGQKVLDKYVELNKKYQGMSYPAESELSDYKVEWN